MRNHERLSDRRGGRGYGAGKGSRCLVGVEQQTPLLLVPFTFLFFFFFDCLFIEVERCLEVEADHAMIIMMLTCILSGGIYTGGEEEKKELGEI